MTSYAQLSLSSAPGLSLTDCQQCQSMCLGPTILPCGHVVCRKCLTGFLMKGQASCRSCGQFLELPSDSVSQLVQRLGTDPVMEHLVSQQLRHRGHQMCLVCDNKHSTMICQNCKECYCDNCAMTHMRVQVSSGHVMQLLPQPVSVTPSALSTTHPSRASVKSEDDRSSVQAGKRKREHDEWSQWVENEVRLLRQASGDQHKVTALLKDILSFTKHLLDLVETEQEVFDTYADCLTQYEVTNQINAETFVVNQLFTDVGVTVKTDALKLRLQAMRQRQQSPKWMEVEQLKTQLHRLSHYREHQENKASTAHLDCSDPVSTSTAVSNSSPMATTAHSSTARPIPTYPSPVTLTQTFPVSLMSATPHKRFVAEALSSEDTVSYFTCIISTEDDKLVVTDLTNRKVKVLEMSDPLTLFTSVRVDQEPRRLALLSDGLVGLTTYTCTIYLLQVADHLTITSQIQTNRQYVGIAGHPNGNLIVSCDKTDSDPARVDIITRSGDVVRTLVDSGVLTGLHSPHYLCAADQYVLVSDVRNHVLHKVNLLTGEVSVGLDHASLKRPRQACVDRCGNMYVVSSANHCVLVRSSEGQWRQLLHFDQYSEHGCGWPLGVCVTPSGCIVVALRKPLSHGIVVGYDLK